jgi:hypothetical protein
MSNEELSPSIVGDKVYAVSSGEYSDYHIDCVFRTRAEAEGWISKRWAPNEYAIEEWGFDTYNPTGLSGFAVFMDADSGDVKSGYEIDHEGPSTLQVEYQNPSYGWYRHIPYFKMTVKCLARDKDHAIKIASEYRRMVLASPLFEQWKNSPDPSGYEMKSNELVPCALVSA